MTVKNFFRIVWTVLPIFSQIPSYDFNAIAHAGATLGVE